MNHAVSPSRQLGQGCQWLPPQPPTFTSLLHETEEVVQELLAFRVFVQFIELGSGERGCQCCGHTQVHEAERGSAGGRTLPVPGPGITPGLTRPLCQQRDALPAPRTGPPRHTLHAGSTGLSLCLGAGMGSLLTTDYFAPSLQRCCVCASVSLPLTSLGGGMTVFQPGKMMSM